MSLTSCELSFVRLLERTKRLAREDLTKSVWKVNAAVVYLENLFSRMQDEKSSHNSDVLMQYGREVNQLRMLVEAEQRKTSDEKLSHLERIPRHFPHTISYNGSEENSGTITSYQFVESSTGVRARNRAFYRADLRKQLMGEEQRRRNEGSPIEISRHEELQESLTNELLSMTRSLKQNITVAGNVIKDDNKRLTSMQCQVESNSSRLKSEGDRLAHHAYKCGFDCMLVFVALFIFWSFICMVVVMKMFPKRVVV